MADLKERLRKARERETGTQRAAGNGDEGMSFGDKALGTARSATEGLTFGWGDEIGTGLAAFTAATLDPRFNDKTFGEIYSEMRDTYSSQQDQFREENPALSATAEIGGGLTTGIAGGAKLAGNQLLKRVPGMVRYPGAGAVSGGAAGAGFAGEGNRAEGATTGAVVGGLTGGVLPAAGAVMKPAARKFAGKFTPKANAAKEIAEAAEADEMTADSLRRRLARLGGDQVDETGRSPVSLADAGGYNILGATRAAQSVPGKGKNKIRTALESRDKGQVARLTSKLDETMDAPGTYQGTLDEIEENLRTKAKPLYDQAYSKAVPDDVFEEISQDPVIADAYSRVLSRPANARALKGYTPKSVKALDLVKRNLDDSYEEARRAGRKNEARELLDAKKQLVNKVDEIAPEYAQARSIYGGDAQKREAMELGERVLKDPENVSDKALEGLSEGDRAFFRVGAKRAVLDKLESAGYSHDAVKRIFNTPKIRKRIAKAFPDTRSYREFQREALRESRKRLTKDHVLGGSPTQRIKAEQAQASGTDVAEGAMDAATGYPAGIVRRIMQGVFNPDTATDPRQAEYVSQFLTGRNPAQQQEVLRMLERPAGLLADERALGTGIGAIGAPAAAGGLLSQ